jgi:hypothetical protein
MIANSEEFVRPLKEEFSIKSPGFAKPPKPASRFKPPKDICVPPSRQVSAHIYPNGEFGIGYVPPVKKTVEDKRQDKNFICGRKFDWEDRKVELEDGSILYDFTDKGMLPSSPLLRLDLGSESSQPKKKYGLKGITSYGKRILRNAGHIMDEKYAGIFNAYPQMGTLTLPSVSDERFRLIAVNWHHIVRRFFQQCKRKYNCAGKVFDYAACTEVQPKRWEERREVGLHLHFLFVAQKGKLGWILPDNYVRDLWRAIIVSIIGEEDIPGTLQYERTQVSVSGSAYIAKYASKGAEFIQEIAKEKGEDFIVSQWWTASQGLKKQIKRFTIHSRSTQAELLLYLCKANVSCYIRYCREAILEVKTSDLTSACADGYKILLGFGGMLTDEGKCLFRTPEERASMKNYLRCTLDNF